MPDPITVHGAVGESTDTCILHVRNEGSHKKRVSVIVTSSSLCKSHGAYASLLVGAECRASHVDLNDTKMHITDEVDAGQHVVLVVHVIARHDTHDICLRLGEIEFAMELVSTA